MGKKIGPRVTVLFKSSSGQARGKTGTSQAKPVYVYMLKSVAEKLGFKVVNDATITRKPAQGAKGRGDIKVAVRGSVGAKRIKVPLGGSRQEANAGAKKGNAGTKTRYVSIPVPASANISDIKKFLNGASKKPASFVSPNGRTYSLGTTAATR